MALTKIGNVIGSGYKAVPRKFGNLWVKQNYLFLYDASVKPKGIFWEQKEDKKERKLREQKE